MYTLSRTRETRTRKTRWQKTSLPRCLISSRGRRVAKRVSNRLKVRRKPGIPFPRTLMDTCDPRCERLVNFDSRNYLNRCGNIFRLCVFRSNGSKKMLKNFLKKVRNGGSFRKFFEKCSSLRVSSRTNVLNEEDKSFRQNRNL